MSCGWWRSNCARPVRSKDNSVASWSFAYAVGPYAEGKYVAFVPWESLKPYLTPEGSAIFAGTRPTETDQEP
jgi:hypothetical protein